jgi:hypothetical protein
VLFSIKQRTPGRCIDLVSGDNFHGILCNRYDMDMFLFRYIHCTHDKVLPVQPKHKNITHIITRYLWSKITCCMNVVFKFLTSYNVNARCQDSNYEKWPIRKENTEILSHDKHLSIRAVGFRQHESGCIEQYLRIYFLLL